MAEARERRQKVKSSRFEVQGGYGTKVPIRAWLATLKPWLAIYRFDSKSNILRKRRRSSLISLKDDLRKFYD